MWEKGAQMQRVSVIEEERMRGKEASVPSKGKGTGDREEDKKGRGQGRGACGQTMRSAARRIEEKSSTHLTIEGTGALWRGYPRWSICQGQSGAGTELPRVE